MRQACDCGRWVVTSGEVGKPVKAAAIGAVALGPTAWKAEFQCRQGSWKLHLPSEAVVEERAAVQKKRRQGKSGWEAFRGDALPGSALWPSGRSGSRRKTS